MADRIMGVAWYRLQRLIDLHQGDAMSREMTKRQKQASRNGSRPRGAGRAR